MMISSTVPFFRRSIEALELEMIRADAFERGERSAQHVVEAGVLAGFLDGHDVVRVLDDTDRFPAAGGAGAVEARIAVGDVVANAAFADAELGLANGV